VSYSASRIIAHVLTNGSIVAVHGLGSNPEWAWTHESGVMLLRDLLPKCFPNARIMAFNHDSKWDRDSSVKSVEHCGKELLDNLNLVRKVCPFLLKQPSDCIYISTTLPLSTL
jgi:hypothetical protein